MGNLLSILLDNSQKDKINWAKLVIINGELVTQSTSKVKIMDIGQWTNAFIILQVFFVKTTRKKFKNY